ncbi:branched-chain alpha-keto acid dehydrogenase subunit E2 [Mangrovactinospora gilvigrisea]|uniref:Dihydrolipoamide acetyltransferase component of pyruvate dehydrogenase complex n=1 Tax=Mangrovactinospora gilvigrisea TaxID=1428644 RepID=A0A1J7BHM3_9ACTN|nr:dihydrolipoamide acetyltransferase family protein [Mangrovactinospora gilvigrisea]OIV38191.1 branched-chain alpha-keto acid dehydrogenase subunit E2 [Mangrovactinospora gilvigrisea]
MPEVREFTLPDLGEGLTEAEVVRWLVSPGDVVAVDQPVVEVETAKASVEVPCPYGGVVTAVYGEPGESLAVGRPLLSVAVAGAVTAPAEEEAAPAVLVGSGPSAAPRRRRRIRPGGRPPEPAPESRPEPEVRPAPESVPEPAVERGPVPVISPLVRRRAREHGLDLRAVSGSGPDGLILRADVERAIASAAAAAPSAPEPAAAAERVALTGIARAAAEKFARVHAEVPAVTCWVDADATELLAARERLGVGVLPLFARIAVAALARHPELNASFDAARGEVLRQSAVHLGVAAQTDRGLLVPVVRDASALSTERLGAEIGETLEAARTGTLPLGRLTGSTFTVNNYGVFGVDGSTPLLNHPEAAMLGVGRIVRKPWAHGEELALRQVVQLSLTFDHRVCDGIVAGAFLRFVADCTEDPLTLLRHL